MKKCFLILFLAAAPLFADNEVGIQGKIGFFFPSDSNFRNVYGGGAIYGPEISWRFMQCIDLFADAMYFQKGGRSLGDKRHTRIKMMPVSLGLKVVVPLPSMEVYFGASAKYISLHIHNSSPYVSRHVSKDGVGWGIKSGVSVLLPKNFFFDIFLEYFRKKFNFHSSRQVLSGGDVDVGGGVIGGSVGYRF